ncbi:MAG: glycosyltransferase, partial [Parcubacteria group bacterium]
MKLSIVIPAYNEEKYIGKCLAGVLAEKHRWQHDVEIIVVNNASTDNTESVARSFPCVIVVNESRKGITRARQAGFEASTGDMIANVDADIFLPPGWINSVFRYFQDDKLVALSGPQAVQGKSRWFNVAVFFFYGLGYAIYLAGKLFGKGTMLQGGNFVVRRSALEKIGGFDTTIDFYGEDTDVARRIVEAGKVIFTFRLTAYTTDRRIAKEGLLKMGARYGINYIWT